MRLITLLLFINTAFGGTTEAATTLLSEVANMAKDTAAWRINGTVEYAEPSLRSPMIVPFGVLLRSPVEARFEEPSGPSPTIIVCDGRDAWVFSLPLHLYQKAQALGNPDCSPIVAQWAQLAVHLNSPSLSKSCGAEPSAKTRPYQMIVGSSKAEHGTETIKHTLCIDQTRKTLVWERDENHDSSRTYIYTTVDRNPQLGTEMFVFKAPPGTSSSAFELPIPSRLGSPALRRGPEISLPRILKKKAPQYDEASRKARIEGTALLYVIVGADGLPSDIRVYRSLTPALDAEAVRAVRDWRFVAGTISGQPLSVPVTIEVNFRLL
jgi:TonB family protein